MTDFLGLSVGMTNLVAARVGAPPVSRRAVLTLYPNRAPEVGVPSENPNLAEPGVVLSGFVERVGDPVPLVASDGSAHQADRLLVEALDAMARTVGDGTPPQQVAIAVPAHWGPAVLGALRAGLRTKPNLSPTGVPPVLVSDAVSALTALNTSPGLPDTGIVALLDFGGSGTSITLADAAADFQPVDETLRYTEFSGAQIDQMLLTHVLADINQSSGVDTAGTTAVGALARLRDQARQAKERLSSETATELTAELPGYHSDVRVTRAELENLINEPLAGLIGALEEMLQRNRIPALAAVATVGGGAAIPLITQRLSAHFRVPVVTTPQPALNTAAGAAVLAARGPGADVPTGLAAAAPEAATGMSTAAWAAGAAGAAAMESAADGSASATFRALAWSQDEGGEEPVPYAGADYTSDPNATTARPQMEFVPPAPGPPPPADEPLPWYRRPQVVFGAALVAVLLTTAGLVWTLTSSPGSTRTTKTSTAVTDPQSPGVPLTQTETVTGSDGSPTVVAPPTSSTTPGTSPTTSETTTPSTTTTTPQTTQTTTTTTQAPTTTTTTQAPPTTTTQAPPTTTQAPPTTTAKPPTSSAAFTTPQTISTAPSVPTVTAPQSPAAASAG